MPIDEIINITPAQPGAYAVFYDATGEPFRRTVQAIALISMQGKTRIVPVVVGDGPDGDVLADPEPEIPYLGLGEGDFNSEDWRNQTETQRQFVQDERERRHQNKRAVSIYVNGRSDAHFDAQYIQREFQGTQFQHMAVLDIERALLDLRADGLIEYLDELHMEGEFRLKPRLN